VNNPVAAGEQVAPVTGKKIPGLVPIGTERIFVILLFSSDGKGLNKTAGFVTRGVSLAGDESGEFAHHYDLIVRRWFLKCGLARGERSVGSRSEQERD
jgi:hypothetical protein